MDYIWYYISTNICQGKHEHKTGHSPNIIYQITHS